MESKYFCIWLRNPSDEITTCDREGSVNFRREVKRDCTCRQWETGKNYIDQYMEKKRKDSERIIKPVE